MTNVCNQCGDETGENNPISRYENDPQNTPMCANCVQVWANRVARSARDETDEIRKQAQAAINAVLRKHAAFVTPRGPMGGR